MAENNDNSNGDELPTVDESFLEEALCVLAGSDPENCSYSRGYVKRQAVFACNTCTPNADEPAGVCLACANKCHEGHNIFELYTKRNFRCDCGNSKFGGSKCQLIPSRDAENVKNLYNHNFHGSYCTCDRLYPDPDGQDSDEMIQCVVCEDWHHSKHLGCAVVESEELQEMVCETCMNKTPFLWTYAAHLAAPPVVNISPEDGEEEEDVEEKKIEVTESSQSAMENPSTSDTNATQEVAEFPSSKRKREEEMSSSSAVCKVKELEGRAAPRPREGAVFWPYNWRSQLCTCTSCKRAYVSAQVQFLLDPSDTLVAYESRGLEEPFGQHPLLAWTDSMSHIQQLEVIYGVQEMTTALTAFFQQCVDEGKAVTAEAVRQCFEELKEKAQKRRRTNAGNQ
ncbi:putative E3 ubiquitin-protein ligase UBR7 [Eucyclogobius newberryi]|uniref:putative E3 ubiquitin-protein ligase UBR7 n=1 Tax=Eucyclogobius newberryi TaxID=166745 RepID=UPI003B5BE995